LYQELLKIKILSVVKEIPSDDKMGKFQKTKNKFQIKSKN